MTEPCRRRQKIAVLMLMQETSHSFFCQQSDSSLFMQAMKMDDIKS